MQGKAGAFPASTGRAKRLVKENGADVMGRLRASEEALLPTQWKRKEVFPNVSKKGVKAKINGSMRSELKERNKLRLLAIRQATEANKLKYTEQRKAFHRSIY
ncbi:unnamed protein product [Acanthoscelides obtectus]|uniref:Uncharacterized protein n=1 Tax=Acanthoscelides obtectus TaxID=200917 RepID=A0A9P0Q2H2_ACAOB|nr:unnamed protein product [Acanthoscelides obtectus]CAK1643605.1 hypothetical protein AOBTE_LOCUS13599 [Acanthoscelides obtectus]